MRELSLNLKSLAHQSLNELGGASSVLTHQRRDHVDLDRMLQRLGELRPEQQRDQLLRIYRLVFPHAFAEESVLWPVIRRLLPDGHQLTLKVEQEHQEINELVARLELMNVHSPERQLILARVIELLRADVRDEEDDLLPRLQNKLSHSQLRWLGIAWEAARRIAPTRAHPIVSRRPPGNVLATLPLTVIDRSRDFIDSLAYPGSVLAPLLNRLSLALCKASFQVERLPGMERGEDSSTRVERKDGSILRAVVVSVAALAALLLLGKTRPRKA